MTKDLPVQRGTVFEKVNVFMHEIPNGDNIQSWNNWLVEIEKQFGSSATLEFNNGDYWLGDRELVVSITFEREETEKEFVKRCKRIETAKKAARTRAENNKKKKEQQTIKEQAELKRLIKKYPDMVKNV